MLTQWIGGLPIGNKVLRWKGNSLTTYGKLLDQGILACDNKKEAAKFLKRYTKFVGDEATAISNVKYILGYMPSDEAMEYLDRFFG